MKESKKYSLLTTVSMIIGIVVGSGIFFRVTLILETINGNIGLGILVFIFASFGIIFGGLTIARYSKLSDKEGGIITYAEIAINDTFGYIVGWFQTIIYFPAIIAVITWAGANYICALFGWNNFLIDGVHGFEVWVVSIALLIFIFTLNTLDKNKAGNFQDASMIIKIIALISLGIIGIVFGNPSEIVHTTISKPMTSKGFFMGLVVVAYAFDGWLIAPNIAHEIENSKRNLPIALTIAPISIAAIYLIYFIGCSVFTGVDSILAGVDPIKHLTLSLFGDFGYKLFLVLIIISILGTLNGVVLGFIRLPYSLAVRNQLPMSSHIKKIHPKFDTPLNSSLLCLLLSFIWLLLHFISVDGPELLNIYALQSLAVDNLPIVLNQIFFSILYLGAIIKLKDSKKGIFYNYGIPILAMIGSSFILYGGFSEPQFNIYLTFSLLVIAAGYLIRPKNKHMDTSAS